MPTFKPIPLTHERRDRLMQHARSTLMTPDEEVAENMAHRLLMEYLRARVKASVDEATLTVLAQFGATATVDSVYFAKLPTVDREGRRTTVTSDYTVGFLPRDVRFPGGLVSRHDPDVTAADGVTPGVVPYRWAHQQHARGYNSDRVDYGRIGRGHGTLDAGPIVADEDLRAYALTLRMAAAVTDRARDAVLSPLRALIYKARTLQAVAEVWPPALSFADEFEGVRLDDEEGEARVKSATFLSTPEVKAPSKRMPRR